MSLGKRSTTISDIEFFHDALENGGPVTSNLFPEARLSLAAALELSCIVSQQLSPTLTQMVDQAFRFCPTWSLFRRIRVSQIARTAAENMLVMKIPKTFDTRWLSAEAKRLEDRLQEFRFPKHLSRSITGAVFEMIDNVWVHSAAEQDPLFAYQVATKSFSFGVADTGLGVLQTLKKNSKFSHIRTSMGALQLAVEAGVSGRVDGSGLGLPTLTRAFADLWGRTRLRSGQAALTFNREELKPKQSQQFLPNMRGFQISAICRLRPPQAG